MTLNLLAPWALAAAALLAVPVAVHLFKPRRVRRVPFSSLRWLKLSPQKLSRRVQPHQILLFLLRAAFVTLLVLALARPVLAPAGAGKPVDRFVVIDTGRAMAFQPPGQPTPLERARELAADVVRRHGPGDRTAVLLAGGRATTLLPLTREPEASVPAVNGVVAGAADTDLTLALDAVRPQLGRAGADAEVLVLTSNPAGAWRTGAVAAFADGLPEGVRVRCVDVGVAGASNAWLTRAVVLEQGGRRAVRAELACVGEADQARTLRLTGITGAADQTQDVTLDPGRPGWVEFTLPPGVDPKGQVARLRLEPSDGLPDDDEWFLPLDVSGSLRVLLVEADVEGPESRRPGFALATAVEALASADRQAAELARRTPRDVTPRDVDAADVVLLADVPDLPDAVVEALGRRVRAGGGLAVFLGPAGKPAFWGEKLYRPVQPTEGLLAVKPLAPAADAAPALRPLADVRAAHPLLAGLADPVLGDLALVRSRTAARFEGELPADTVLARFEGGEPAVIDRGLGAGRVLLFNTGADDAWSDLTRRRSFVPLVDRALNYLSAGGARRTFTAGEPVTLALPGWREGEAVAVVAPNGDRLTPEVRPLPGGRGLLRLDALASPGAYAVDRPTTPDAGATRFVVQAPRGDSPLTAADPEALRPWFGAVPFERVTADEFARTVTAPPERRALWPWLVALAGLVFAAEMYFVHRLCPSVAPTAVTTPLIRRKSPPAP
jgi:hypothetical protein